MGEHRSSTSERNTQGSSPSPTRLLCGRKCRYNLLCRLFYCWLDQLFFIGARGRLEQPDLYAHPSSTNSRYLLDRFNRYWSQELEKRARGGTARLWVAIGKCFWWKIVFKGFINLIWMLVFTSESVFLGYLVEYFFIADDEVTGEQTRNAYLYALGLATGTITLAFCHAHGYQIGYKMNMDGRIVVTSAIYQKVLSLSQSTVGQLTIGHVVNLASNDVHRFDNAFVLFHLLWIAPLHVLVVSVIIYIQIGPSSLIAVALAVFQVPLQVGLAKLFSIFRLRAARITDSRVKVMNEVITGIRVIKMYAWEYAFKKMVDTIRKTEAALVLKGSVIRAFNLGSFSFSLPVILFAMFSVYSSTGGVLTPQNTFTAISLLTTLRLTTFHMFVQAILNTTEAAVAVKRIQKLLLLDDLPVNADQKNNCEAKQEDAHVCVDGLTASWFMDLDRPVLSDISLMLNKNNPLLAVVGPVGAGKSSLLQCLLRELPAMSGSVTLRGSVAYASQESWVYSATLRENILFGLQYSADWYNTVVEACALDKDIELLSNGDLTLVGERGVTLSGGQKARVNLARAVYRNADVYLLDDPLSAVDAAVSRHIFDKCIRGLLCNHCVVLVTHQLQYVQQCDTVLVLKEGRQVRYGDPAEVLSDDGDNIVKLIGVEQEDPRGQFGVRKHSIVDEPTIKARVLELPTVVESDETDFTVEPNLLLTEPVSLVESVSISSHNAVAFRKDARDQSVEPVKQIMVATSQPAEERAHGSIGMKTYYKYFTVHRGHLLTLLVMVVFIMGEVSVVSSDLWLSYWAGCSSNNTSMIVVCNLTTIQNIGVYGGLTGVVILFSISRTTLFFLAILRSSRIFHNKMFAAVLRAPVLFFDTNPVGRVLNRFSKDVGFLDDILPFIFCEYLVIGVRFLAVLILAMIANVYLIIAVVILVTAFVLFRMYYIKTAREIKRLEAIARSPIYSHLSTTLQGLAVIRSYSMQTAAMDQFHSAQNQHSVAWYMYLLTTRWFGLRIDLMSSTFISLVAFSSIPLRGTFSPELISLAITYVVSLGGMLQFCIRQSAEVESLMVSAERVMGYSRLDPEPSLETHPDSAKPPPDWPDKGHIELSDVTYRHYPDGPLVLKGVTATILPSEKIGIVGRTGAGKSSLIATLFRLAEPNGSIKIDGMECSSLGLHDVRSKIAIIPQDPVLFSGTVRYNLDPFQQYHDHELWTALEQVQLKGVVEGLDGKLDAPVSEGGTNFSVGQRQLFCLGRALLKRNHILVLDEATANVDLETDAIIQNIIREEFSEQTVLTIAHRLDTVMDSDKIMVLRSGQLIEYGDPYELLCEPNSYLRRLVEHTGPVASQKLTSMARSAHEERKTQNKLDEIMMMTPL